MCTDGTSCNSVKFLRFIIKTPARYSLFFVRFQLVKPSQHVFSKFSYITFLLHCIKEVNFVKNFRIIVLQKICSLFRCLILLFGISAWIMRTYLLSADIVIVATVLWVVRSFSLPVLSSSCPRANVHNT